MPLFLTDRPEVYKSIPMKFVIAGLGFWGKSWASLLNDDPRVDLVAVVDPLPASAEWTRKNLRIPHFSMLADALANLDVDAVLVTTPPGLHAPVAIEALARGKHVLLEKPLAATLDDAHLIAEAAANFKTRIMVAQGYRFLDAAHKIRSLLAERAIGDLRAIRVQFRQCVPAIFADQPDHPLYALNHSILIDMAVHHFDLVRYMTQQEIAKVSAAEYDTPENIFRHPSNALCRLVLRNDVPVFWDGDWCVYEDLTCWEGDWEFIGSDARLFWRGDHSGANSLSSLSIQKPNEEPVRMDFTETVTDRRVPVLNQFLDSVAAGVQPEPSIPDNLRTLSVVFACVDSIERQTEITLTT